MVSQSQDGVAWDGNGSPSRTGSLLSLDGRQRPTPAKTPPSYYDAVRSRHSLSQPRPTETTAKDAKCVNGQQVKYNSLPRPLPQRYPPALASAPGHQQARPWPPDGFDPARSTPNPPWRAGDLPQPPRQLYESPPKPANHVPLQLRVHGQDGRHPAKRGPETRRAPGPDQTKPNGAPRADRLTVDCGARGNSADIPRKNSFRSLPMPLDVRSPPIPPGRNLHPRSPSLKEPITNSLSRRDSGHMTDSHRYAMPPDGSPGVQPNYPPRPVMNGGHAYEPRYSKSGKLTRPLSQGFESKPMPPPIIQLRTGPLGSYPDPETLKRAEHAYHSRNQEERLVSKATSHNDVSQQIYVDTPPYANGKPAVTDHLAIPYRIPQVSPTDERPFSGCNGVDRRKEVPNSVQLRGHPPQLISTINGGLNQQYSSCPKPTENRVGPYENRLRQYQDVNASNKYNGNGQSYCNPQPPFRGYGKQPQPSENGHFADDSAIYANHDVSVLSSSHSDLGPDKRPGQKRSPQMASGNAMPSDKQSPKNCYRETPDISREDSNALYANQPMASARYKATSQHVQQGSLHSPLPFHSDRESGMAAYRNSPKAYPGPPAPPKQRPTLPQPSEMVMVTETRGWNGQASSYPKDLVKPTPRMPRFASGTQLTSVPAYQCVINELSSQNIQQSSLPNSSDSSTLSLRSGYDSSSSSVRDFGRQPCKSDSSLELRKSSEGGLKTASSQQCIDKSFLSASMTSLCSDTSSSISTRKYSRYHHEDPNWDRMTEEFQKRKEKGSVFIASPWEREEKEKLQQEQLLDARRARDKEIALLEAVPEGNEKQELQQEQLLDARRARDKEIALLEAVPERNEKQEEWLRILRLEREFQRRAEQELNDDEEEEDDDDAERSSDAQEKSEKVNSFHGDKMNAITNERLGLKLLDQLLEDSSKSLENNREFSKSPSEKHFIPLELTIPDRDLLQSSALPAGNNILQVSDPNSSNASRLSKPPVPAPRPSKVPTTYKSELSIGDITYTRQEDDMHHYASQDKRLDSAHCSLSKLEISNGSVCYNENGNPGRDYLQDSWMIEVSSFNSKPPAAAESFSCRQAEDHREGPPRIYENVTDFPMQHPNAYAVHTLPKATSKDSATTRGGHFEKKFPAMGVTSTLSRKLNGHVPSDADILPALYASSKVRPTPNRNEQLPSDLEDQSPEFKKIWVSRPEKLTFQDKIRKFSIQAGEDDPPRDRVKNSRAQREIETKFSDGQRRGGANYQDVLHK